MEDINLKDLILMFLRKWWILLICLVICGSGAYVWTDYFTVPTYAAYTTLYVGKNVDQYGLQTTDLYLGTNLIDDYREIARSKLVANEVIEKLGLKNTTAGALASRITVTQRNETRVIQISVTDTNPQLAFDITNTVAEVFREKVMEIMQVQNVQIIDRAELPRYPVSPNKNRNYMLGLALGFALGIGIILLTELLDNTVRTPEDVQKYAGLPVIGTIPVFGGKRRIT